MENSACVGGDGGGGGGKKRSILINSILGDIVAWNSTEQLEWNVSPKHKYLFGLMIKLMRCKFPTFHQSSCSSDRWQTKWIYITLNGMLFAIRWSKLSAMRFNVGLFRLFNHFYILAYTRRHRHNEYKWCQRIVAQYVLREISPAFKWRSSTNCYHFSIQHRPLWCPFLVLNLNQ